MYKFGTSEPIKLTLLGDADTGKTSAFKTFKNGYYSEEGPQVSVAEKTFGALNLRSGLNVEIQIYDSRSSHNRSILDRDSYVGTNVFLVFFDVNSTQSFENATDFWYNEILNYGKFGFSRKLPGKAKARQKAKRSNSAPSARNQYRNNYNYSSSVVGPIAGGEIPRNLTTVQPHSRLDVPILLVGNKVDLFYQRNRHKANCDNSVWSYFAKHVKRKTHIADINYISSKEAEQVQECFNLAAYYGYLHSSGIYRPKGQSFLQMGNISGARPTIRREFNKQRQVMEPREVRVKKKKKSKMTSSCVIL